MYGLIKVGDLGRPELQRRYSPLIASSILENGGEVRGELGAAMGEPTGAYLKVGDLGRPELQRRYSPLIAHF